MTRVMERRTAAGILVCAKVAANAALSVGLQLRLPGRNHLGRPQNLLPRVEVTPAATMGRETSNPRCFGAFPGTS